MNSNVSVQDIEGHVGGTVTKTQYTIRKKSKHSTRILSDMTNPETYYYNSSFNLTCGAGTQNYTPLNTQLGYDSINNLFQDLYKIMKLNANVANATASSSLQSIWKIYVETIEVMYYFTSYAPAAIELDIYDLAVKRYNNSTPDAEISRGFSDRTLPGNTVGTQTLFGFEPKESHYFTQYFTIKKQTHVTIPPGGTHKHKLLIHMNKWISQDMYNVQPNVGSGSNLTFSQLQMVNVRGYPIKYTASNNVTSDSASVACVGSHKIRWRAAPFNASVVDYANNLATGAGAIDVVLQAATEAINIAQTLT